VSPSSNGAGLPSIHSLVTLVFGIKAFNRRGRQDGAEGAEKINTSVFGHLHPHAVAGAEGDTGQRFHGMAGSQVQLKALCNRGHEEVRFHHGE
jgi:hypothetical protein